MVQCWSESSLVFEREERAKYQNEILSRAAQVSALHRHVEPAGQVRGEKCTGAAPSSSLHASAVCEVIQHGWLVLETVLTCQVIQHSSQLEPSSVQPGVCSPSAETSLHQPVHQVTATKHRLAGGARRTILLVKAVTLKGWLQPGHVITGGNRRAVRNLRQEASWSLGALDKSVHIGVGLLWGVRVVSSSSMPVIIRGRIHLEKRSRSPLSHCTTATEEQ